MRWALGVDLGGTAVKLAVIEEGGGLVLHERHATVLDKGPEGIVSQIAKLSYGLYRKYTTSSNDSGFCGIGVGVPGAVDKEREVLSYPPNLPGWTRFPLRSALDSELSKLLGRDAVTVIDNDANAAALGEAFFGAGKECNDFMLVTLGTGVGGGIVLDRSLYRGSHGSAGEIGYMTIDFRGSSHHAGITGTVESLIGKQHIASLGRARYREHARELWNESVHGPELSRLSPRTLEKAARAGDTVAESVWDEVGTVLGVALASVTALVDIRTFLIGGGISAAGDLIVRPAYRQLLRSTLPSMHDDLRIIPASLGNQAGVYGAAALCFDAC
ncbi:ROK family protein [Prosthecochloris sp. HL-130-GSB]|jgi:glucokinase|uniref:ROK family protein n=1 Tax=Prosthecochloris sp. HL-130-GSB TaxID=1974213 RepID=UPI000A1C0C86|nr:ROK family protein [Prosthecochloris sp. HL-130-GSB]ARM31574.1 sugar kinase [Prosthecochloris sp. HL-130-GSB]